MIADVKKLIEKHNDVSDGVYIKTDIDDYILKLANYATILPYYNNSRLKGFIAYYANDILKQDAYLTMIIIDKEARGEGLGNLLLQSTIFDLVQRGFKNYRLEVLKHNTKAIKMYEKFGFIIEEDRTDMWMMNLKL